ncbi:MAG: hypothetical protein NZ556_01880 [Fimbriimonadales bacterium]|nr:hypothetical protein [Fimbriimonadales bacterium]
MDSLVQALTHGQDCPCLPARAGSLCYRCTDKTVRATQGRRRLADATQRNFLSSL